MQCSQPSERKSHLVYTFLQKFSNSSIDFYIIFGVKINSAAWIYYLNPFCLSFIRILWVSFQSCEGSLGVYTLQILVIRSLNCLISELEFANFNHRNVSHFWNGSILAKEICSVCISVEVFGCEKLNFLPDFGVKIRPNTEYTLISCCFLQILATNLAGTGVEPEIILGSNVIIG